MHYSLSTIYATEMNNIIMSEYNVTCCKELSVKKSDFYDLAKIVQNLVALRRSFFLFWKCKNLVS